MILMEEIFLLLCLEMSNDVHAEFASPHDLNLAE